MAIEDSTSYELTGAQVKDLANKIKGKAADNTFVGATSAAPGSKGLVPEPQAGDDTKFLSGNGSWKEISVDNYSTNEVNTGATWIDGKPIYKKTIDFGALPNATNKKVKHNISNLDRIIRVEQSIDNNGTGFLEISSGNPNNNIFNLYGTATEIGVTVSDDRSGCYAYFTLWYTKTTD